MLREGGSTTMKSRARGTRDNSWIMKATMRISLRRDIRVNQGTKMVTMKIGPISGTRVNQGIKTVIITRINGQKESKIKVQAPDRLYLTNTRLKVDTMERKFT